MYYELRALENQINNNIDDVRSGVSMARTISEYAASIFGSETALPQDIADAKESSEKGIIPSTISYVPGDHPLAIKQRDVLTNLLAVNRAIELNTNALKQDETAFGDAVQYADGLLRPYDLSVYDAGIKGLTGQVGTPEKEAEIMSGVMKQMGLELDDNLYKNYEVNNENFLESVTEVGSAMTPMITAIALTKKMPGVKPSFKALDNYSKIVKNSVAGGASKIWNGSVNVTNAIAQEYITFKGANVIMGASGQEELPEEDAVYFGAGNSMVKGLRIFMMGKYIPVASEVTKAIYKIPGTQYVAGKMIEGGGAVAVAKGAESAKLGLAMWNGDDLTQFYTEDGHLHLFDAKQTLADWAFFSMNAMTHTTPYQAVKRQIQQYKANSEVVNQASQKIGVKRATGKMSNEELKVHSEEVQNETANRLEELKQEKSNRGDEMSNEEYNRRYSEIVAARDILDVQWQVVAAQKAINSVDKNNLTIDTRLDKIAQKIATDKPLTYEESKLLGEIEAQNPGTNNSAVADGLNGILAKKITGSSYNLQANAFIAVSYTHLTLPTIYSV